MSRGLGDVYKRQAYFGYYVKGGALEVGKASTNAVVMSSIMILLADVIMTHLMLT